MSAIEIETETESTKSPLTLTFRGFEGRSTREHVRGERASVMLNPKTRTLSVFKSVGSGVPELVWNFEARMFALPECASLDDIQEVLEAKSELISELFDIYEGREWTGGKYEGKWSNVDRVQEIMESLTEACADEHSVKRYWAPSERRRGPRCSRSFTRRSPSAETATFRWPSLTRSTARSLEARE